VAGGGLFPSGLNGVTPAPSTLRRGLRAAAGTFAVLAVATLCGCPFTSDKPLSDPAAAVSDSRLPGTWRTQDPETGEWNSISILAFNEREMVALAREKDPDRDDVFRLLLTSVGADRFLSFQQLGGTDEGWYYARCEISQDILRLKIVDDALFANRQFGSSRELWDFFHQHLADPLLYSAADDKPTESVWERVPTPAGDLKSKS
jgi:hypothetical protein